MSFVSIIANEKLCCIMSDGRLTNRSTGEIAQEDLKKYDTYNNNTSFIASTGTKGVSDYILKHVKIKSNNYDEWIDSFEKFYDDPGLSLIFKLHPQSRLQLTFGGLNHKNQIELYSFNYIARTIKKHKVSKEEYLLLLLGEAKYFDGPSDIYKRELEDKENITASDLISVQKLMNNHVADLTPHVNKNTYRLVIKKQ
ncbi:hypothetical protein [Paenibacillus xylanilyticus]|uniref:Uncharacterized protein n=1 Tax=Paenibacillus xylanilyticus TaxID=248903 RepID=A0A7Y6C3S3_9BACL|nr:hypothetical protein [Paenibacillus xylanilyticus]NUU80067.1 hypothetical protein [Paenibacillus xylanilyticus]